MSTNSTISIQNKDGSVNSIYCHWDGYPEGVGAVLKKHYTSEEKIRELLSFGAVSSLGEHISPDKGVEHTFENRAENVCCFYGRERDEDCPQIKSKNYEEYLKYYSEEYNYLYRNGVWELH